MPTSRIPAAAILTAGLALTSSACLEAGDAVHYSNVNVTARVGPRPFFLVDDMTAGTLKTELQRCRTRPFHKTRFSIGHRGAALQFPEHTRESYLAAARQGAGIIECDATFTKDGELVCRHSQCDLHTTTNILKTPLADKCTRGFQPATYDADGNLLEPASATCCTSDITLAEFKMLKGKMDGANTAATTIDEYMAGTPGWRTDLYTGPSSGTLMTHAESVELFKTLHVGMTPELKAPSVAMPFELADGTLFTYDDYRQKLIDELKAGGIRPQQAWVQSFVREDIDYWIANEPTFAKQAVYLIPADTPAQLAPFTAGLPTYKAAGINYVAPPLWALVDAQDGEIVPSNYAKTAKAEGLKIITWTLERSGILADGDGEYYYQTINNVVADRRNEGVTLELLDVLARDVGIEGIFSDWPATVTFYANCMGLR